MARQFSPGTRIRSAPAVAKPGSTLTTRPFATPQGREAGGQVARDVPDDDAPQRDFDAAARKLEASHSFSRAALGPPLQSARDSARAAALASDSPSSHDPATVAARAVSGARAPLPHLDTIQSSFGRHDISGVRAAVGAGAGAAARALGGAAFAIGGRVALRDHDLHTAAHEAAHIVQRRVGLSARGERGGRARALEERADAVADLVVAGRSAESLLDREAGFGPADEDYLDFSGFEDTTKYYTYIYLLKDENGYIKYVGKTYQKPKTRKAQHNKSHPEREDYALEIADEGNWTVFETATFEQWYIDHYGGTAVLDNMINGITKKKFHQYKHLHSNYCIGIYND